MAEARAQIGVLCAYVPRELIEAAGFAPRMVSGLEAPASEALPTNLCAHARRAAALLTGPCAAGLAGVVVADSCYPMLRLWDLLERSDAAPPHWLLHVPRRATPLAARFFREELARLAAALAARAGLPEPDRGRLAAAIEARNGVRESCQRVAEALIGGRIPRLTPRLLELLEGREGAAAVEELGPAASGGPRRRPRLALIGSHFVTGDLLELLAGLGADVRAVESCAHHRLGTPPVALGDGTDPLGALAGAYLELPPCPRMEAGGEQAESAARLAEAGAIDGAVYLLMKSCTPHAYAVPLWRRRLERAGAPLLALEVEDADWSQPRLATRLEAFVESLAARAAS